jgi:hypothetical protein
MTRPTLSLPRPPAVLPTTIRRDRFRKISAPAPSQCGQVNDLDLAEALALWVEVTKRKAGNENPRDEKGRLTPSLDNIQEREPPAPTGTSAAAGLRKLQKAANEGNGKADA